MHSTTERSLMDTDEAHEARIKAALDASTEARSRSDLHAAQVHWNEAVRLIAERSPAQVAKMEKEKVLS